MRQLFVLCHEGEVPYVVRGLQDALLDDPSIQIVSQGRTEKMYMGYVLLEGNGEIPAACLAELRANPDIYLYAIRDPDDQDGASDDLDGEACDEAETFPRRSEPVPLAL